MKTKLLQCDTSTDQDRAELSKMLGEVLRGSDRVNHQEDKAGRCVKCLLRCGEPEWQVECVSKPIPLTWPEAMKWRDWAVEKFGSITYKDSLVDIYCDTVDIGDATLGDLKECMDYLDKFIVWLATKTRPHHYLKAAALCVLNSKGENNG